HHQEMLELNLTRGVVRKIETGWEGELKTALQAYDVECPVTGTSEGWARTFESPKYLPFTSETPLQEDIWFFRDPEPFLADYDRAFAELIAIL
ncbi:hypothetical protein K435DRAFT_869454, partial [Dendrothele bispora CBS 962.96]